MYYMGLAVSFSRKSVKLNHSLTFYASAFRRRRHYVFGLSFRSPKYPLSSCKWVCWSIRPIMTVFRLVPSVSQFKELYFSYMNTFFIYFLMITSVRRDRFPGIFWRTHDGNGLKFCMLMYPDRLQNRLDFGHALLIFLIMEPF